MARATLGQANGTNVNVPTTIETVIASIFTQGGGGLVPAPAFPLSIEGSLSLTPGTAATSVIIRVRLGSVAGTIVFASPSLAVTAAAALRIALDTVDALNSALNQGGATYVITIQQAAATGNGTVNDFVFRVELP